MWCKYLHLNSCCWCSKNDKIHQGDGLCQRCYSFRRRRQLKDVKIRKFEWSFEFPSCVSCKTTDKKHTSKGLCSRCFGRGYFRKRTGYIPTASGWSRSYEQCLICKTTENKYESNGLCHKCYSRERRRKQLNYIPTKSGWSRRHESCISCSTTQLKHQGKGLCRECYLSKYKLSDKQKSSKSIYMQQQFEKFPWKRCVQRIRTRTYVALKGYRKTLGSNGKFIGCSLEELKQHLEKQFKPGMTWENYGKWHVDHIQPLSSFNLQDDKEIKKACHFTNLQPLWARENLQKSNKVFEEQVKAQDLLNVPRH